MTCSIYVRAKNSHRLEITARESFSFFGMSGTYRDSAPAAEVAGEKRELPVLGASGEHRVDVGTADAFDAYDRIQVLISLAVGEHYLIAL